MDTKAWLPNFWQVGAVRLRLPSVQALYATGLAG